MILALGPNSTAAERARQPGGERLGGDEVLGSTVDASDNEANDDASQYPFEDQTEISAFYGNEYPADDATAGDDMPTKSPTYDSADDATEGATIHAGDTSDEHVTDGKWKLNLNVKERQARENSTARAADKAYDNAVDNIVEHTAWCTRFIESK